MTAQPFRYDQNTNRYLATQPLSDEEIVTKAKEILAARLPRSEPLSNSNVVRDHLAMQFAGLAREAFVVLFLDNRHRLLAFEEMFRGTVNGCAVYPREVARAALQHNAAAVIFAHNHPSGVAEPSRADELLTTRLKEVLSILEIRVLDHFVVGGSEVTSFVERGLL